MERVEMVWGKAPSGQDNPISFLFSNQESRPMRRLTCISR